MCPDAFARLRSSRSIMYVKLLTNVLFCSVEFTFPSLAHLSSFLIGSSHRSIIQIGKLVFLLHRKIIPFLTLWPRNWLLGVDYIISTSIIAYGDPVTSSFTCLVSKYHGRLLTRTPFGPSDIDILQVITIITIINLALQTRSHTMNAHNHYWPISTSFMAAIGSPPLVAGCCGQRPQRQKKEAKGDWSWLNLLPH